jgi:hypothetical protein
MESETSNPESACRTAFEANSDTIKEAAAD